LTVGSNTTLALTSTSSFSFTPASATVNGTISVSNSATLVKGTGTLSFNTGSTYIHNRDGGAIPTATWNESSTTNIAGMISTSPTGFNQSFGNFSWNSSNTGTNTTDGDMTVKGNFTLTQGTFSLSNGSVRNLYVLGNYIQSGGIFNFNNSTSSVLAKLYLSGNLTNTIASTPANGSMTTLGAGAYNGEIIFNGTAAQTISITAVDAIQWASITVNANSSLKLLTDLQLLGNNSNAQYYANFTVNGTIDVGTYIISTSSSSESSFFYLNSGASILTANTQGLSTTSSTGSIQIPNPTFNIGANYTYNGSTAQMTGIALTGANNLTINNIAGVTLSATVSVSGVLTLSNGILTTSSSNLLNLTNTATTAISGGSTTAFVNGSINWTLPASLTSGSTYNFPVGKGSTYLPFSLVNPTTGTSAVLAKIEAFTSSAGGTVDATLNSISSTEYWTLSTVGDFTNSSVSATRTTAISPNDVIAGSPTVSGQYTTLAGTAGTYGVTASNSIGSNRTFVFASKKSTIVTGSITGSPFSPNSSVSVPFTITGSFVSGNIFTAQLSDNSGSFTSAVNIGTLTSTTAGTISATIPSNAVTGTAYRIRVISSNPEITGTNNGTNLTITNSATITVSKTSLSGFSYDFGSGPSAEQTFTVSGSGLSDSIYVAPSTNFEISTTSGSNFQSTAISLKQTGGTVSATTIYVRLKSGLSVETYASENIISTSTGATSKTVVVSGSVYATYCSSSGSTSYETSVTFVDFNTISNSSAKPSGYSNYTSLITNVYTNNSYNLTVNLNTDGNWTVYANAWIDWNHNGSFDDDGESYPLGYIKNSTNGATSSCPLSVTIPSTAVSGNTRMRVSARFNSAATACGTNFDGEVEDYTLNVIYPTITTGTISGSPFTDGSSVSVPFTVSSSFLTGNIFTAQLSNASGSFTSPISIGTLTSTTSGTISATIPTSTTTGTGYRIRVISSSPVVTGSDNGTNLSVVGQPFITTSTTGITGFTYPLGYGPSTTQSFTVSGTNLTGNISLTPSSNYQISTTDSPSFVSSSIITLPVVSGSVVSTPIYVRLKAGLALGTYSADTIKILSSGTTTKKLTCSGSVVTAPVISTSAISGTFSYVFGAGPSSSKTFKVSATNLGSSVIITPPTDYEISSNGGTSYQSTAITLSVSSGNTSTYTGVLDTTIITIRLKSGLSVGSYSENVVASSTSAVSKNVAVSGTITASTTIFNAISFLSGFIYTYGNGPSGIQSFVVKGIALADSVTVTPPTNFEISKNGSTFQLTSFKISATNSDTIVYVRMKSGLAVNTYGPLNSSVVLTSSGAITKSVACKGQVVASSSKTLLASRTTLTGFGYEFSHGPSSPQTLTVSGASLTANIVVTAPTNYEISLSTDSSYSSSLSLALTGTRVNPTYVYVRLKSGLAAGDYGTLTSPVNLTITSTGATALNVSLIGKIFTSPLIAASGGGNYCEGDPIYLRSIGSDIQSFYWTGPNSYYTTTQNPTLTTNATASLNGTYIVNGSVVVGGNLVTNGDFEAGNTSFSSGYGYVEPSSSALWPEALYTVVQLPSSVHSDFTSNPDHTTGSGYQMVVNGASTAGVVVWSQSVPVIPGATYQFSYSEQTVNITQVPKNASQLQLYVNGVSAGPVYTAPLVNYQWDTFVYNAAAGTNRVLNLELINQNTVATGNDFALDDIIFQQILPATADATVVVGTKVPVSVSVAASPGTDVYSNTTVTFTATPTNGGATPTYQWQVKTAGGSWTEVGSNSTTYTYIPLDGDSVSCTLTSSLTCVTNNPAIASVNMVVTLRVNYWMGYTDTDWGKPENWTADYVPLTGEDVEYATVANFGTSAMKDLWLDHDRTIGSLINATTKRLVIPAAKGLIVNNTVNTDGSVDRIYIYGSDTQAQGSLSFHNLESQPVSATVEMYSKASINHTNDTINNIYKWQYFGSPLRSVKATPTFNGSYVRKWYETGTTIQNHWIQLQNDSIVHPFYGYEICQESPKYLYFKGQLVNSDFNSGQMSYTYFGVDDQRNALYPGQHVFANPYTAAIDITQLEFGANVEASVYLYNTGTFSIWEFNGEGTTTTTSDEGQYLVVPQNTAGSLDLPSQVPSMQSMLVKALGTTNATFNINYNSVIVNNTDLQRVKAQQGSNERICTKIDVVGKEYSDKMWLFTDPSCTRNFDNGWDGYKIIGNSLNPQIYAIEPDGNYQVNAVNDINNTLLAFQAGKDLEYNLVFTQQNLQRYYQKVYLLDLVENKTIDITESGTVYKFYAESTPKPVNRFQIVTRPYEKNAADVDSKVKVFSAGKNVFVHNEGDLDGELIVYDIYGRYLLKKPFVANGITTIKTNYITGGYIVRIKTAEEEFSKRIIITK
ncbi:MAG: GEVED domain-containing protein, partial [Paludibacter sp.]|nr:GEVED domain-containing protein [Paludibacter sp.]